jgi:hypothetical protein
MGEKVYAVLFPNPDKPRYSGQADSGPASFNLDGLVRIIFA